MAEHDFGEGHYYHEKKKKRDRVTGLATPPVVVALTGQYYTTGPFIAETIWVCNGDSVTAMGQIYDGTTPLTCPFNIAPGTLVTIMPLGWMPFFTQVGWLSDSMFARLTVGGWIP